VCDKRLLTYTKLGKWPASEER